MVIMMVGHLISKLVSKFKMNPSQASKVANDLVPNILNELVTRTNSTAPSDSNFDFNDLIGSLTAGGATGASGGHQLKWNIGTTDKGCQRQHGWPRSAGHHRPGDPWCAAKTGTNSNK